MLSSAIIKYHHNEVSSSYVGSSLLTIVFPIPISMVDKLLHLWFCAAWRAKDILTGYLVVPVHPSLYHICLLLLWIIEIFCKIFKFKGSIVYVSRLLYLQPLLDYMPDYGLFEASRMACPVLPQYHPKQLMELLNSGKIRWVKAILAHLVRWVIIIREARSRQQSVNTHTNSCSQNMRMVFEFLLWIRKCILSISLCSLLEAVNIHCLWGMILWFSETDISWYLCKGNQTPLSIFSQFPSQSMHIVFPEKF